MSASVGDIVAQLRDVRERLANAAVTAMRAKADTDQAHSRYMEAAQGTDDPLIKRAIDEIHVASAKTAKYASLLGRARKKIAEYSNRIAPGSAPDQGLSEASLPSGQDLLGMTIERSERRRTVGSFVGKITRNIENVQDAGKNAGEVAQNTIKVVRNPFEPRGSQTASTAKPSASAPSLPTSIKYSDAAGHIVVVGLIVGIMAHRISQVFRKRLEGHRARGAEKRAE